MRANHHFVLSAGMRSEVITRGLQKLMSMDLSQACFHCGAKKGELCKPECSANGEKIQRLMAVLDELDLDLDEKKLKLKPQKVSGHHGH